MCPMGLNRHAGEVSTASFVPGAERKFLAAMINIAAPKPARAWTLALMLTLAAVALPAAAAPPVTAAATLPMLELDVELDPATRRLDAVARIGSDSRQAAPSFKFALHASLQVKRATLDGRPVAIATDAMRGDVRTWHVDSPPRSDVHAGSTAGERRSVTDAPGTLRIEYGGTLPALDRNLDHRDVLQTLPPMAASEGSFLPAGSGWYPEPAVRFAYRVSISVPADQRALVPGRLVSESLPANSGGRYRARFEFATGTDGVDLMAGPWIVRERMLPRSGDASGRNADIAARSSDASIRLRTYFPSALDAAPGLADSYLDDTRRYIERYSAEIGVYPYTEFSVVAGPLPTGFGMPTLTYLGADVVKLPFIRATSLGHEVLHNWWGNGVEVDYARGNWCEGLTTFMADYAYQEDVSPEAAREMRLRWLRDFAAMPVGSDQSLASFRSRAHGAEAAVGYGKSAMVFVMLKDLIGADAFRRGIRDFWAAHRFKRASWSDLRQAFEQASGRSLTNFFAQWVDRAGAPTVRVATARAQTVEAIGAQNIPQTKSRTGPQTRTKTSTQKDDGSSRITVAIEQAAPTYELRLPIALVHDGGTETRWVDVARERDIAAFDANQSPDGVRLDPDLRVWRRLDSEQLPPILRQWIIAPSPVLVHASTNAEVRAAAEALGKRLFERPAQTLGWDALGKKGTGVLERKVAAVPILLVGLHADVDAALARSGLPPRPSQFAGRGSAQVWTIARTEGAPVAVISAANAEAITALQRPLPHYGSQSWLVFDGAKMLERGVWPGAAPMVPVATSTRR